MPIAWQVLILGTSPGGSRLWRRLGAPEIGLQSRSRVNLSELQAGPRGARRMNGASRGVGKGRRLLCPSERPRKPQPAVHGTDVPQVGKRQGNAIWPSTKAPSFAAYMRLPGGSGQGSNDLGFPAVHWLLVALGSTSPGAFSIPYPPFLSPKPSFYGSPTSQPSIFQLTLHPGRLPDPPGQNCHSTSAHASLSAPPHVIL